VDEPAIAEPGMTVCLEPNRTVPGVGNLTSEEEVLVTADGVELLSPPFPDALHVVG
jgi:Xaa-Pro aminopeptidase